MPITGKHTLEEQQKAKTVLLVSVAGHVRSEGKEQRWISLCFDRFALEYLPISYIYACALAESRLLWFAVIINRAFARQMPHHEIYDALGVRSSTFQIVPKKAVAFEGNAVE